MLDRAAAVIRTFDDRGRFQVEFSGRGQGPGEMTTPGNAWIEAESEIVVFDVASSRRIRFGFDGHLVGTERLTPPEGLQRFLELRLLRHEYSVGVTVGDLSPQLQNHDPYRAWVLQKGPTVVETVASFRVPVVAARWRAEHGPALDVLEVGPGIVGTVAVFGDSLLAVVDGREGEVTYQVATEDGLRAA